MTVETSFQKRGGYPCCDQKVKRGSTRSVWLLRRDDGLATSCRLFAIFRCDARCVCCLTDGGSEVAAGIQQSVDAALNP